jgi:hypothetical protein
MEFSPKRFKQFFSLPFIYVKVIAKYTYEVYRRLKKVRYVSKVIKHTFIVFTGNMIFPEIKFSV